MPSRSPSPEARCPVGHAVKQYWNYCSTCDRSLRWPDSQRITGAECYNCGWMVSDHFSWCPWCGVDIYEKGVSAVEPIKNPRGFRLDTRCDWGCGGRVSYPMEHCPWCGKPQGWNEDNKFEGNCPHCSRGVDDWMVWCPWCGNDATGQDLIQRALTRSRRLLLVSRIKPWGYRVLLRPGVSGVDPRYPKVVEIEQRYATGRRQDEIPWTMLTGLIVHELGHSFLYHHWRWTRSDAFRRVFGEVEKAYRVKDESWVDFQRHKVAIAPVDHVSAYAMQHPQEDFAETFRFYITRLGRLRDLFSELGRKRKGVVVYEKFLALHDYVRQLRAWR